MPHRLITSFPYEIASFRFESVLEPILRVLQHLQASSDAYRRVSAALRHPSALLYLPPAHFRVSRSFRFKKLRGIDEHLIESTSIVCAGRQVDFIPFPYYFVYFVIFAGFSIFLSKSSAHPHCFNINFVLYVIYDILDRFARNPPREDVLLRHFPLFPPFPTKVFPFRHTTRLLPYNFAIPTRPLQLRRILHAFRRSAAIFRLQSAFSIITRRNFELHCARPIFRVNSYPRGLATLTNTISFDFATPSMLTSIFEHSRLQGFIRNIEPFPSTSATSFALLRAFSNENTSPLPEQRFRTFRLMRLHFSFVSFFYFCVISFFFFFLFPLRPHPQLCSFRPLAHSFCPTSTPLTPALRT